MNSSVPHYRLFSTADSENRPGYWRFCFQSDDGTIHLDTEDLEPEIRGARLELLTLVRALEALDEPATVTLVTGSRFIREGLRHGITEWKRNGWRWERFGRMIPVRNADLWQRIDCALAIHRVSCVVRSSVADSRLVVSGSIPAPADVPVFSRMQLAFSEGKTNGKQPPERAGWPLALLRRWKAAWLISFRRLASQVRWSVPRVPTFAVRLPWRSEMNRLVPK